MTDTSYKESVVEVVVGSEFQNTAAAIIPPPQPKIFINSINDTPTVYPQENLGDYPIHLPVSDTDVFESVRPGAISSSVMVFPTEGGGRGPTVAGGVDLTLGILLPLLNGALSEEEFVPSLVNRLDGFTNSININTVDINDLEESSFNDHNSIIQNTQNISGLQSLTSDHTNSINALTPTVDQH